MLNWQIQQLLERHQDMLREAEARQAVSRALADLPQAPGLRSQAMLRLGGWMVSVGRHMQARYGQAAQEPARLVALSPLICAHPEEAVAGKRAA